jgi:two-component system sensor histidine kinase DegS
MILTNKNFGAIKMVFAENQSNDTNAWEELAEELHQDVDQKQRELQEISMLVEQSQLEVNKLAQRNATATSKIQQIHGYFDSIPREDIRLTYDGALDAQQRLFVMRGQLEKLQSDQNHLQEHISQLELILETLSGVSVSSRSLQPTSAFGTVEAIIQAQEAERQRLSRQMHDGPAQALSNFILQTEIAMRLFDMNQEQARDELENLKQSATAAFQKVRDFIFELRPMMLDDLGLVPTLKRYVEAFKEQNKTDVRLAITGVERRLESYIEVMIFRAIQELMGNAVRHSQANRINIHIDITDNAVKVGVEDNGKGFDVDTMLDGTGMGVKVIKERVEMLGGHLELKSTLGEGSNITFNIPTGSTSQSVFA